ncbi:hypothetical protein [Trichlorobacter ammonificans]|uniref:ThiI domain-containing protein n=1 Tax=Trichlorobacter ammonificans TaxID=2916410 RepID=A0ABN8HI22_9BACT|nr:hypothetical protein [Trichlorobacter ammonificans]CAH2032403.1 ThiI domain-containing protein [Trichlorobacter ammonificans]
MSNPPYPQHPAAPPQRTAVALLSGGLDSTLAVKLMLEQGIRVVALNFTSPFCTCTSKSSGCKSEAVRVAQEFNIPITVKNKGIDYLEIVRAPRFGYGKGLNPCIDCRIFLLQKAGEFLRETGADFVITGEVLGQRPMSQRRDALLRIEQESGLAGLILRPLSARHFEPTIPENEGWVDREKLLAIEGRSRKEQIQLAEELDLGNYPCPAGGCMLTEPLFVPKLKDLFEQCDQLEMFDIKLLKTGRHFRLSPRHKLVLGRDERENDLLAAVARPEDTVLLWQDGTGPCGLLTGPEDPAVLDLAAALLLHHTKATPREESRVLVRHNGHEKTVSRMNDLEREAVTALRL